MEEIARDLAGGGDAMQELMQFCSSSSAAAARPVAHDASRRRLPSSPVPGRKKPKLQAPTLQPTPEAAASASAKAWHRSSEDNYYRAANDEDYMEHEVEEPEEALADDDDQKTEPPSPPLREGQPGHREICEKIDWDSAMAIEIEKQITFHYGAKFKERGPPGPDDGGPQNWRGQQWREGSKRWGNRGGKKAAEISAWYAEQRRLQASEGGGGSSSSSKGAKSSSKGDGGKHSGSKGGGKAGGKGDMSASERFAAKRETMEYGTAAKRETKREPYRR